MDRNSKLHRNALSSFGVETGNVGFCTVLNVMMLLGPFPLVYTENCRCGWSFWSFLLSFVRDHIYHWSKSRFRIRVRILL